MSSSLPFRGVVIHNPDLLSKNELIAQFSARQHLLDRILTDLRSDERPDHRLLVGHRGMGKTTLLRRIYFSIEDDPSLAAKWLPLAFPEEQYNIDRLSELYLNCIDALSDTLDRMGEREKAIELDRARDGLPASDEATRAGGALELLLRTADAFQRKLLLLIDNMELVLNRLRPFQWEMRELLGHESRIVLIGTSVSAPEEAYEHGSAFYNFLRMHELRALSEQDAREMLLRLAEVGGLPSVTRIVHEEPVRLRIFHTLAGGNPRTLVHLYSTLSQSPEGDERSDLDRLLDQFTPLYKARFETLSPQAQKIVDALAIYWHPMTVAELAAKVRLDPNVVASQITRLERDGVLEKVATPAGGRTAHQLSERLFNTWYLMRQSRRVRQKLVWLVEFLRLFFGQDLGAHARARLRRDAPEQPDARKREVEYRWALAEAVDEPSLRRALLSAAVRPLADSLMLRAQIPEIVSLKGPDDKDIGLIIDKHRAMVDVYERVLTANVNSNGWDPKQFAEALTGSLVLSPSEKMHIAKRLNTLGEVEIREFIEVARGEVTYWKNLFRSDDGVQAMRHAFQDGYMDRIWDSDGAQAAAEVFDCRALPVLSLGHRLLTGPQSGEETFASLTRSLEQIPQVAFGWYCLGVYHCRGRRYDQARSAIERATEIDPTYADAWQKLADIHFALDRYHDAERAYRSAIENDPKPFRAWLGLGYAGQAQYAAPGRNLGHLLEEQGRTSEAEEAYRKTIELDPSRTDTKHALARILLRRGRWDEPADLARTMVTYVQSDGGDQHWPYVVGFFAEAVRARRTTEALQLMQDMGLAERWLPLHAALEAIRDGRSHLLGFAPEIRGPAQKIMSDLEQLSGVSAQAQTTRAASARKAPRRAPRWQRPG